MERLSRFLLSNGNLAGGIAAVGVVGLYLTGVIHHYWMALATVAYAGGFVSMYRPSVQTLPDGVSTQESLDWLRDKVLPKLPSDAGAVLSSILGITSELMPRLKDMEAKGLVQTENRVMLKQTITRYLPDIVESYLKLPPVYARSAKVADNKTPNQLLVEQLTLLETHVAEIREGVLSKEVDGLLANGRFLQDKFSKGFRLT